MCYFSLPCGSIDTAVVSNDEWRADGTMTSTRFAKISINNTVGGTRRYVEQILFRKFMTFDSYPFCMMVLVFFSPFLLVPFLFFKTWSSVFSVTHFDFSVTLDRLLSPRHRSSAPTPCHHASPCSVRKPAIPNASPKGKLQPQKIVPHRVRSGCELTTFAC